MKRRISWLPFSVILFLGGCVGKQAAQALFQPRSPYYTYQHKLEETNLLKTKLGQAWLEAGKNALTDSLLLKLPYQETGYFQAEKPGASSYNFLAKQGEMLEVKISAAGNQEAKFFLDLFGIENLHPRRTNHVASADSTTLHLQYVVEHTQAYLLRLQPELLASGSYTISIVTRPSLKFPVPGKDSRAILSNWGSERDNGARKHEGLDIFAPKGTPAIASINGVISQVNETKLGGKVVWLTDLTNHQNIYYAHLSKQLVQPGQVVKAGDTLGLIGNTGNAKKTPPHLHFGVYTLKHGAVDPFPYIYKPTQQPTPITINQQFPGHWGRSTRKTALIRNSPDGKANILSQLTFHTAFQILAGTGNWYKVQLPTGLTGFLYKTELEIISKPIATHLLKNDTELMEKPEPNSPAIALAQKNAPVNVLGYYKTYQLVELNNGSRGWLPKS